MSAERPLYLLSIGGEPLSDSERNRLRRLLRSAIEQAEINGRLAVVDRPIEPVDIDELREVLDE